MDSGEGGRDKGKEVLVLMGFWIRILEQIPNIPATILNKNKIFRYSNFFLHSLNVISKDFHPFY